MSNTDIYVEGRQMNGPRNTSSSTWQTRQVLHTTEPFFAIGTLSHKICAEERLPILLALGYLSFRSRKISSRSIAREKIKKRPYRVTFILVPVSMLDIGTTELHTLFSKSLVFYVWHCTKRETSNPFVKQYIIIKPTVSTTYLTDI